MTDIEYQTYKGIYEHLSLNTEYTEVVAHNTHDIDLEYTNEC